MHLQETILARGLDQNARGTRADTVCGRFIVSCGVVVFIRTDGRADERGRC